MKKASPIVFTHQDFQAISTLIDTFIRLGGLDLHRNNKEFILGMISVIGKLAVSSGELTTDDLVRIQKEEDALGELLH